MRPCFRNGRGRDERGVGEKMKKKKWFAAALAAYLVMQLPGGKVYAGEQNISTGTVQDTEDMEENVYLGLDTVHIYENMNASFAQGYIPIIEENVVHLTVPFVSTGELRENKITVDLDLGTQAPFVYASYQTQVEKQTVTFEEQQVETYLYQCDIRLEQNRMNGTYPVVVKAAGYDSRGRTVKLESRVFVTVTDGKDPSEKEEGTEEPSSEENGEAGNLPEDIQEGTALNISEGDLGSVQEEIIHQPRIILESNSLNRDNILAGGEKELKLTFKNSSKEEKIFNLKITGKAGEDVLILGTGSFYFETVAPQETIELTTMVFASPAAEQKSIPVEFSFEYENDKGTAYTGTEQISVDVRQSVQMVMEGFDLPKEVYSLENITAGLQVRNVGRAPVYNVQVDLSAEGLFPVQSIFAGNLEAGAFSDGSMKIYVGNRNMESAEQEPEGSDKEKYGSVTGKLVLTYEDAFGQTYTQEQEIATVIQKPRITELKVEKEVKETNQWWLVSLAAAVLLFGSIVAVLGWKLKKNRNILADLRAREETDER